MIQTSPAVYNESDDELCAETAVAISILATFIITLIVSTLMCVIITRLYYKHLIDRIRKSALKQESDPHALTEDIKRHDPSYATTNTDVTMDTNPAYATTVKMNPNPAYGTTTAIKMYTNPAYATTH